MAYYDCWVNAGGVNAPEEYKLHNYRSEFLLELMSGYTKIGDTFLELGCNIGRNLNALVKIGHHPEDVYGLDVNPDAIIAMRLNYGSLNQSEILVGPMEDLLPEMSQTFDVVFSMAALMHVDDEAWKVVSGEIARMARRVVVTVEDESLVHERFYPRDYREELEPLGFRQVKELGMGRVFRGAVARVFRK